VQACNTPKQSRPINIFSFNIGLKDIFHYFYNKKNKMLTKDKVKESINKMPDSFTIDELIEQLIIIEKIEQGILQSNDGKVISNNEMQQIIEKWSS
jgi:hypothetical protein